MKIKLVAVSTGILFLFYLPIRAEDDGQTGIWLDNNSMTPIKLQAAGDIPDILESLEYDDDAVPFAFAEDLNGDGQGDYLIIAAGSLCGTGGCHYTLVDGRSLRRIGDFFGSPILIAEQKINGFPVIHTFSHASAGSGTFTTLVYDGREYRAVSSLFLAGESVDALFKSFADYRKIVFPETSRDK